MSSIPTVDKSVAMPVSLWRAISDTEPLVFTGKTRLAAAIAQLRDRPTAGCVLSVYRQKVVGIATRQDLMVALAQNPDWASMRLSEVVRRPAITVTGSAVREIAPIVDLLERHQISYLPVVDERKQLLGVIDRRSEERRVGKECLL